MSKKRRIAVVTGSRAEFGLLRPVMQAIRNHPNLELYTIVTGMHWLMWTHKEVEIHFGIDLAVKMQEPGETGRIHDAQAIARGIDGFAKHLPDINPFAVLVLGDRIEPFAAAAACAVGGIRIAHMHGGDRAEGIADESMRHAISKLAHIHFPATEQSAQRLERMGENRERIHLVGSPAIDGIDAIPPMGDDDYLELGRPKTIVLFHPTGRDDDLERADMETIITCTSAAGRTLLMEPNHDAGRNGIIEAIKAGKSPRCTHIQRDQFLGLLKRARVLIGNSSAGLIEAAALGVPSVNIGSRQNGREKPASVFDVPQCHKDEINAAIAKAIRYREDVLSYKVKIEHPYGDGHTGERTAEILATLDPALHPITKRNSY